MMFGSTGSGVAHPLSPPSTPCHSLREIVPPERVAYEATRQAGGKGERFAAALFGIAK